MIDDSISNPGIPPTSPTPGYGRDKPRLGEGEEAQEPKPFSLKPEGQETAAQQVQPEKPSPMDIAKENAEKQRQQVQASPEELQDQITKLRAQLNTAQANLQNPHITQQLTEEHYGALGKLVEKMNPDIRSIAKHSKGEFNPPQHVAGEPVLNYVTRWINGSQETLSAAMNYLGSEKNPNPASFLRLQYSIQRATQRGELFASIVGASVSGIKTIMSTQLG